MTILQIFRVKPETRRNRVNSKVSISHSTKAALKSWVSRHRQPNLKHLRYDLGDLTAGLAVRDLNTVDVRLDRRSLDCVVGLGQGLLELVWNDLILNQLLKMRDQSLLRRSGIIQLQPAFYG